MIVDGERLSEVRSGQQEPVELANIVVKHSVGSARRHLEKMELPLNEFSSCLIVADESKAEDPMDSDSLCISTLLLIRDIQRRARGLMGNSEDHYNAISMDCPVLSEILDPRTESSVSNSPALMMLSEFVQSNEMVSRYLAMVSEERSVNTILKELLGGRGCGFECRPASVYVLEREKISFAQLAKRMTTNQNHEEVLIGYQLLPAIEPENTVINPRDKDDPKEWDAVNLIVLRNDGPPLHPHLHGGDISPMSSLGVGVMN